MSPLVAPTALFFLSPQEPILSQDGPPSILKQTFAQQCRNTFYLISDFSVQNPRLSNPLTEKLSETNLYRN